MNRSPKSVGEISEAQVLAAFLLNRETVLTPFGDNQRYDLVLDRNGEFLRVQVKTARIKDGAVSFRTCSSDRTGKQADYVGQCDLFAAYCPDNHKVYVVPVGECGARAHFMRAEPAKNGQLRGIRLAVDYEYPRAATQPGEGADLINR